jgi:glycosyltransferase involved in cell wall biosynthesis
MDFESSLSREVSVITFTDSDSSIEKNENNKIYRISRKMNVGPRLLIAAIRVFFETSQSTPIIANGGFLEVGLGLMFRKTIYIAKIPGDIVWERAVATGRTQLSVYDFQNAKLRGKYWVYRKFFTNSLKRANTVIVPALYLKDLCINWGISPDKIVIIKNSVDTDIFTPNTNNKDYDVITVSRLVPVKRIDGLIRACAKLELKLLVVGDGPLEVSLKKIASDMKANATFIGHANQTDLPKLYRQAKVFVLNSDIEATSYALLEARSCGLIGIANTKTGSVEVINHLTDGILCGTETGFDLERALIYILSNDFNYLNASEIARSETVREYSRSNVFREIDSLLFQNRR